MKCVLRNKDGVMVKNIDRVNCTLELTEDNDEALSYTQGEWFAKTELEYLQFHMGKEHPELETMTPQYVNCSNDSSPSLGDGMAFVEAAMPDAVEEAVGVEAAN